jgi:transmembrane sensor
MKAKAMTSPITTPKGGSVLDWPLELGLTREVLLRKLETRRKVRRLNRVAAGGAALLAIGLFIGFWAVPYVRDTGSFRTLVANRQVFALADGSDAELNADTRLRVDFRHGRRVVDLQSGEAFFSVARDPAHPFSVRTPAGTIRVTGTRFDVRLVGDRGAEVTLLEGAVSVEKPDGSVVGLAPGQQFESADGRVRALSAAELSTATSWQRGEFAFGGLTLAEAAERLGRYHGRRITVAPEIAGLRPDGVFPVDNLSAILSGISSALSVKVIPAADGSYSIIPDRAGK